jgi:hypothetical protein
MEQKIRLIKTFVKINESENEFLSMIKEFDANGNMVFLKEYDETKTVVFEHKNCFDDKGKIISEEIISHSDDYGEKKSYKYDDNQRLIEERIDYDGGWFSIKKYERDMEQKSLTISCLDEDGELEELAEIKYNSNGDILSKLEYDEEKVIKEMHVNTFDENGILVLKEEFDNRKKLEKAHHYYYAEGGKINAIRTLNAKGNTLDWVKIAYDQNDKPVEQQMMSGAKVVIEYNNEESTVTELQFNPSGEMVSKIKTIKNKEGNVLEEHSPDKITRFEYEYF